MDMELKANAAGPNVFSFNSVLKGGSIEPPLVKKPYQLPHDNDATPRRHPEARTGTHNDERRGMATVPPPPTGEVMSPTWRAMHESRRVDLVDGSTKARWASNCHRMRRFD